MKQIFTSAFTLLLFITTTAQLPNAAVGWEWTGNDYRADRVRFVTEQKGYLWDADARITTDGGQSWTTWSTYHNGVSGNSSLMDLEGKGNHVIAISMNNAFVSFDGENFTSTLTPANWLKDLFMLDEDYAWIVGKQGIIYKTTNGGANWIYLGHVTSSGNATAMSFSSSTNGVVGNDNGTLYYTTNGGTSFTAAALPASITSDMEFKSIIHRNANEVLATASSYFDQNAAIIRSTNGGQTWTTVHADIAENIFEMNFQNNDTVYAVGGLSPPRNIDGPQLVLKSIDGGATWAMSDFYTTEMTGCPLLTVSFLNPDFGWMAGWNCIYKYKEAEVTNPTAIQEVTTNFASIYPNPANSNLKISLQNASNNAAYTVTDLMGKTVLSGLLPASETELNISALNSGMYQITITAENQTNIHKFVKQ